MKDTRILMDMPVTVEIIDSASRMRDLDDVFDYFRAVEERFSVFKDTSEISRINRGEIDEAEYSPDMKTVFALSEETKKLTNGYFDIMAPDGRLNPSGLVKGWAIHHVARMLDDRGLENFYVEVAGDMEIRGKNAERRPWAIGIRNPFNTSQIVKVLNISDRGVATSGTYIRGQHVYDPFNKEAPITDLVSLTVIGPNVYEADRFATAAFAMSEKGIGFIENLRGFEGYAIDRHGIATMTSGFNHYVLNHVQQN